MIMIILDINFLDGRMANGYISCAGGLEFKSWAGYGLDYSQIVKNNRNFR